MTVPGGGPGGNPGEPADPSSYGQFPPPAHPAQNAFGAGYGQPYDGGWPPNPLDDGPPQRPGTNTMAIASLVTSIVGFAPFCGGVLSIVGIVLGAVALSQIKETPQDGYGLAVAGIVVGVATLIIGLIWTIFALR